MAVVRGVNVFPSAIENIIREIPEIEEFRVEIFEKEEMLEIKLLLEPRADEGTLIGLARKASQRVRECIGFRPHVELVKPGTLPRFELKAKRFFKI